MEAPADLIEKYSMSDRLTDEQVLQAISEAADITNNIEAVKYLRSALGMQLKQAVTLYNTEVARLKARKSLHKQMETGDKVDLQSALNSLVQVIEHYFEPSEEALKNSGWVEGRALKDAINAARAALTKAEAAP